MKRLNIARMRKHNRVDVIGERGPEICPEGATVIRDASGQVVRILRPPEKHHA